MSRGKQVCTVEGCGEFRRSNGYCSKHFVHWKSHGHPWIKSPKVCIPCHVIGCGKVAVRGLKGKHSLPPVCGNHEAMHRKYGRVQKTKPRRHDYAAIQEHGCRGCTRYKAMLPLAHFNRITSSHCRECSNSYKRDKRGVFRASAKADRALTACVRARTKERQSARLIWAFDNWGSSDPFLSQYAWHVMSAMGKLPHNDPRLSDADRYRLKYRFDPTYATKERLRRQVTKARKRLGVQTLIWGALKNGGRSPTVERECGWSIDDLRQHLERQFTKGMSWDRFMAGEIHIDHIVPVKEFDVEDPDEFRTCWSLPNLRPLWATESIRKGARRVSLL